LALVPPGAFLVTKVNPSGQRGCGQWSPMEQQNELHQDHQCLVVFHNAQLSQQKENMTVDPPPAP